MEGISFIFLSYLRCENIIQILEFLCIEYNIHMKFWSEFEKSTKPLESIFSSIISQLF